jgi:FkbM family methyltransferase
VQLVDGFYIPDGDLPKHHVAESVVRHDAILNQKVLEYTKAKRHMVDVGGNVGRWSVDFAKHFATVSAFEPAPYHIECFEKNCASYSNIKLYPYGLSNTNKKGNLEVAVEQHLGSTRVIPSENGNIELKTLDEHDFEDVDVLKVDVEGLEIDVLQGAEKTIAKCKPIIVIERCVFNSERFGLDKMASHNELDRQGYKRLFKITRDCIYGPK